MEFIQDLQTDRPLNTYNNNIIEYRATNTTKIVVNSTIEINGVTYELTPNLNGIFRFNFLQVAKAINNLNNFKDEIEPDITTSYIYNDSSLFKELTAEIKIIFSDTTEETQTNVYSFFKSVEQIIRQKATRDNRLFPLVINANKVSQLTYFEGYPYDIPFYSDADREIKILNKNTQHEITVNVTKGVNRLFVSDGKTNLSLENILALYVGFNELEFKIDNDIAFTVILKKVDAKCGVFIKWFNQAGGYSYWLFPNHTKAELKPKTIEDLVYDFHNLDNSQGNFLTTGKTAGEKLDILSQPLTKNEFYYLQNVFVSPKVELLAIDRYLVTTLKDWVTVKVLDNKTVKRNKDISQYIPISIQLPNLYTQTL